MKKLLMFVACLCGTMMFVAPTKVVSAATVTNEVYTYETDETTKTCGLVAYHGNKELTELTIPATYNGYTVTQLNGGLYGECTKLAVVYFAGNPVIDTTTAVFSDPAKITFYGTDTALAKLYAANVGANYVGLTPVTGVTAKKDKSLTKATVSFTALAGMSEYQIYYKSGEDAYVKADVNVAATATSAEITGLPAGKKIDFKVLGVMKTAGGTEIFTPDSLVASATLKPAKVKGFKGRGQGTAIKISWKRNKSVDGYQISRKVHVAIKGFKSKYFPLKTVKKNKITSLRNIRLVNNMKYSYKIRTFKKVNGKKIYSDYVEIKKIKA